MAITFNPSSNIHSIVRKAALIVSVCVCFETILFMTLYPINSLPHSGFLIAGFLAPFSIIFLVQSKKHINQKLVSFQKMPLANEVQTVKKFTATEIIAPPIEYWNSIFKPFFTEVFSWLPLEDFLNSRIVCHRWKEESALALVGKQFKLQFFEGLSFKSLFQLRDLEIRLQNATADPSTIAVSDEDHLETQDNCLIVKNEQLYSIHNLKENALKTFKTNNHLFFDVKTDRYLEIDFFGKTTNPTKHVLRLKKISNSEEIKSSEIDYFFLHRSSDFFIMFSNECIYLHKAPTFFRWDLTSNTFAKLNFLTALRFDFITNSRIIKSYIDRIDIYDLNEQKIEFSHQVTKSILHFGIIKECFYYLNIDFEFKCIDLKTKKVIWNFTNLSNVMHSDVGICLKKGEKHIYLDLERKIKHKLDLNLKKVFYKLHNHFLFYNRENSLWIYNLKKAKIIKQIDIKKHIQGSYKNIYIEDVLFTQEHFVLVIKADNVLQTVVFSF